MSPMKFPEPIQIRHRIIGFEVNPLTKELTHAKCACEYEGTIDQVRSHIKNLSQHRES
jgi:hypothetical protein